jgi:hypothetical protein
MVPIPEPNGFRQRAAEVGELGLIAFPFTMNPHLRVGGRLVRTVATGLAMESMFAVATGVQLMPPLSSASVTPPRRDRRAARFHIAHCPLRHRVHAQWWPDERPANQGGTEAPAWTFIVRRRFAHHRSIAFSAARMASPLAPAIEPSSGLGGV